MAEAIYAGDAGIFKTCPKCGETKSSTDFHKDKGRADGLAYHCKVCARLRASNWYADNPEKGKANAARRREDRPDDIRSYLAKWYVENQDWVSAYRSSIDPAVSSARAKAWAKANPDKVRERSARRREDPKFRLENSFRIAVSSCIRRGSKKSPTFAILGYTPDELRSHLEILFTDGMSWRNYGRGGWHVDHVFPLASFAFKTPDCPDFKKAFALSNLQPLWEPDNCSKRDRLDHPSQAVLFT